MIHIYCILFYIIKCIYIYKCYTIKQYTINILHFISKLYIIYLFCMFSLLITKITAATTKDTKSKWQRQLVKVSGPHPSLMLHNSRRPWSHDHLRMSPWGTTVLSSSKADPQTAQPVPEVIKQTLSHMYISNSSLTFRYMCMQIPNCMLSNP